MVGAGHALVPINPTSAHGTDHVRLQAIDQTLSSKDMPTWSSNRVVIRPVLAEGQIVARMQALRDFSLFIVEVSSN